MNTTNSSTPNDVSSFPNNTSNDNNSSLNEILHVCHGIAAVASSNSQLKEGDNYKDVQDRHHDDDNYDPLSYYHDTTISYQSPLRTPPCVQAVPTPTIHSPDLSSIQLSLNLSQDGAERRNDAAKKLAVAQKKRKVTYSPSDSMLLFLREDTFCSNQYLHFDSSAMFKQAYKKYSSVAATSRGPTWKPFLALKSTLSDATYPLTELHQRLLIEDFMMLKPGDSIICLISANHYFLEKKSQKITGLH